MKGGAAGWAAPKDSLGKGSFFSGRRSLANPPISTRGHCALRRQHAPAQVEPLLGLSILKVLPLKVCSEAAGWQCPETQGEVLPCVSPPVPGM